MALGYNHREKTAAPSITMYMQRLKIEVKLESPTDGVLRLYWPGAPGQADEEAFKFPVYANSQNAVEKLKDLSDFLGTQKNLCNVELILRKEQPSFIQISDFLKPELTKYSLVEACKIGTPMCDFHVELKAYRGEDPQNAVRIFIRTKSVEPANELKTEMDVDPKTAKR